MKQNMIQTKKGIPLNQAFGAILTLVLIGVLVIIAIFLFVNLGSTFNTISASTTNETEAYLNQTGYTLVNSSDCNFNTPIITAMFNATTDGEGAYNLSIDAGDYSVTGAGILRNATNTEYENVSVSYTYLYGGEACIATNTMITQFGNFPILVGLIGTIIFLGLVIGVLVLSFAFGGRKSGV